MPLDANLIKSISLMQRGGEYFVPADTGTGDIFRPTAEGQRGGRIATFETYFDYFINNVPPPDEAKQLNPNIEQVIRMHPDVIGAHNKRVFTVSQMPWRIEANKQAPQKDVAEAVADHCRRVMENLPNHHLMIEHLQYAVLIGGQGLEFRWHTDATGVEYPVEFYPVHMSRFLFDRLGNMALLTRDNAVWGVYVSDDPQSQYKQIVPRGKFVYHQYRQGQGTWDRPQNEGYVYYGIGEDVVLYYPVTFDIWCLKYRMKFLETYGLPPKILYYPENRQLNKGIVRIVNSLRGESVIAIPRLVGDGTFDSTNSLYKVDQLPVPTGTYDHFEAFSDRYTKPRVDTILLGSADESQKQEGKGGYADHVSRRDAGPNVWFKRDARTISQTITNQLMPAVAMARYPNLPKEYWPIYTLEPKEEKDRLQELQIIETASKMVPVPESSVYDAGDLKKPEIDPRTGQMEKTVGGGQPQDDGMGMPPEVKLPPEITGKERTPIGQGNGHHPAIARSQAIFG
jgi:phage gp29-like protein